jgi:ABC-type branched-subunit amino acid transport system substrate-binding protein
VVDRTLLRWSRAIVVLAVVVSCSSKAAEDTSTGSTEGTGGAVTEKDAVGVTADTIKLSLIYGDLAALSEQHLAPEIGNAAQQAEAVVADINAKGGLAGRKVQLVSHVIEGADAVLSPEAGRAACLAATEDDKPFAVIIAASIGASVVDCVATEHDVLTIAMDSFPKSYYDEADGRLFSVGSHLSMQRDRAFAAWPKLLEGPAGLGDKTIGIIRTDQPVDEAVVDGTLKPAIDALGLEVAAEATLPCPEGSQNCSQHDAAIQRMKSAGVDFVFLVAQLLAGSATVDAANNVGYETEWTTLGNNITETVAQFFVNAKDTYDGAWGIDTGFKNFSSEAATCNQIAAKGGAEKFAEGSDGYGFTGVTCMQFQALAKGLEGIKGAVTQAKVIAAIEGAGSVSVLAGPKGTITADKHDAGDYVFLSRYSAKTGVFEPFDDRKPRKVP